MSRSTLLVLFAWVLGTPGMLFAQEPMAAQAPIAKVDCGETDPDCRRRLLFIMNGIHVGQAQIDAAYRFGESQGDAAVRFKADVISFDSMIGDLAALPFEAVYFPELGGFRLRVSLIDADVLFFCKDEEGKTRWPLEGLLHACEPTGYLGLGAGILEGQWDTNSGRSATRWAEINVVLNFLKNGNGMEYLRKRLSAYAGASLDTTRPGRLPVPAGVGKDTDLRLNFGVMGMLRSENNRLEIRGYAGYRPNVTDFSDAGYEAKVELMYHLLFNRRTLGTVGLEGGLTHWDQPWKSIGSFASATDERTYFLRLMFRMIFQ